MDIRVLFRDGPCLGHGGTTLHAQLPQYPITPTVRPNGSMPSIIPVLTHVERRLFAPTSTTPISWLASPLLARVSVTTIASASIPTTSPRCNAPECTCAQAKGSFVALQAFT